MINETKDSNFYTQIGARIRERRKTLGMSQVRLAELLDMSYQQLQKYEAGLSQLSVSKLLQLASILNINPDHFYHGIYSDEVGSQANSDVITRERLRPMRILLVEDNAADALLFQKTLNPLSEKATMHCINDSELTIDFLLHAQSKYAQPSPDLIILDLNLPKLNGLQLLKKIKSNPATCATPCVILTNSISRREMEEAYALGCAGFIQKSMDFSSFKEGIRHLVDYWATTVALPQ